MTLAGPAWVGIGASRCGTTWWHSLIVSHPDITAARRKELHFIDQLGYRGASNAHACRYHSFFRGPGPSGEWTPRYLEVPWAAAFLADAAPDARLIVILRDPVSRFVSALAFARARGATITPDIIIDQAARSRYLPQLERYARHFPREQLLVLQYEQITANPAAHLAATYRHLGVGPHTPSDRLLTTPQNTSRHRARAVTGHAARSVQADLDADASRLFGAYPELDPDLWTVG